MAQAETALLEDEDQIEELETDESLGEELAEEDQEDDLNAGDDNDEGDETQDDEDEIVLEGDDGSHPEDEQRGIRKRINKLNGKVAKANEGEKQSSAELETANERIRLMQLALDNQTQSAPVDGPPDPNDFEDGALDAKYTEALTAHITNNVTAGLAKTQQSTHKDNLAQSELAARQIAHVNRADKIKVKDYDETENIAISSLGLTVTNEVIKEFDKSPEILYYLGKNPKELERISTLIKDNKTFKAVGRLAVIDDRLKKRTKSKQNPAPNPDGELSGGGSGRQKTSSGPKGATFE